MLLKGLKVVDFSAYIAGPGAAGILCDWGAEVIKVERPGGDSMRHTFADVKTELSGNPLFELDNRGKRGIVLDIAKAEGRDALAKLAAEADVFLTNVRPASLKRAGLDDETLMKANPRLVYAVITGYGLEGPDAHKPGFDVTAFWARAGVGHMMAPKGTEPFMLRTGVGDHTTSLATVAAILAGLYEREQTGKGRLVQTSLLATGVYAVSSDLSIQMKFGRLASMKPRNMPLNPMSNLFRSSDGHWFVHNPRGSGAQDWPAFCGVAGRQNLLDDARAATGRARRENSVEITAEFDKAFGALTMEEIARRLDAADLAWAPLQTSAQVVADPQVMAAGAIVQVEDGEGGTFQSPAAPALFPGVDAKVRPRAPLLGEHTRQVLAELGYGEAAIEAMVEAGAAA